MSTRDPTRPVSAGYTLPASYTVTAGDVSRGFAAKASGVLDVESFKSHITRSGTPTPIEGNVTFIGNPAAFRLGTGAGGYTLTAGDVWFLSVLGYAT